MRRRCKIPESSYRGGTESENVSSGTYSPTGSPALTRLAPSPCNYRRFSNESCCVGIWVTMRLSTCGPGQNSLKHFTPTHTSLPASDCRNGIRSKVSLSGTVSEKLAISFPNSPPFLAVQPVRISSSNNQVAESILSPSFTRRYICRC